MHRRIFGWCATLVVAAFVVPAPTAKGAPVTWTLSAAPDPSSSPIPIASGLWTYDLVVKDPSGIASSLGAQDLVAGSVVAAAPPAVAIMEPSTFGVVIGALGGLALIRARRRGHP